MNIKSSKYIILTIALGMYLWSFSAGIVNISLPIISQYLDLGTNIVSLIILIHLIVLISFLIIFGRVGELIGYKKVYIAGICLFTIGSYFCGISNNIYELISFRILQGIGSAMLISMVTAIIPAVFPHNQRGKIFGYISVTTTLGLTSGYGFGGYITEYYFWNFIFLAVVPLGIVSLYMAHKFLPSLNRRIKNENFDIIGSLLILLTLLALIIPIMGIGNELNMGIIISVISLMISIIFGIIFFYWESKIKNPLLDLSILKNVYITISVFAGFFASMVLMGTIFLLPFYLELVMGYSPALTGLVIISQSLVVIFIGPISGYISDKIGSRIPTIIASISMITAIILLTIINETIGITFIILALCIRALSEGMFTPANNKMVMGHSPKDKLGSVSSILNTARYLGLVLGIIIFNEIFNQTISIETAQILGTPSSGAFHLSIPNSILLDGFHNAFIVGIIISILVLLFSYLSKESENQDDGNSYLLVEERV